MPGAPRNVSIVMQVRRAVWGRTRYEPAGLASINVVLEGQRLVMCFRAALQDPAKVQELLNNANISNYLGNVGPGHIIDVPSRSVAVEWGYSMTMCVGALLL